MTSTTVTHQACSKLCVGGKSCCRFVRRLEAYATVLIAAALSSVAYGQVGCSRQQFQALMRETLPTETDKFAFENGLSQFSYLFIGTPNPLLHKTTCVAAFDGDEAVCVRWHSFSFDHSWDQAFALLSTFDWRIDGGRRRPAKFRHEPATFAVFPPLGRWSVRFKPIMVAKGQQRTVTINARTGQVVGASPWRPRLVNTGLINVIRSARTLNVAVLVSEDRATYAMVVASKTARIGALSQYYDPQVETVVFCRSDWFWRRVFWQIRGCYDSYEMALTSLVPAAARNNVIHQRLLASILIALDRSILPADELRHEIDELLVAEPQAREPLLAGLRCQLASRPLAVQRRRIAVLESTFAAEAIGELLPLMRNNGVPKSEAAAVISRLAASQALPTTPSPDDHSSAWTKWAKEAGVVPSG